MTTARKKKFIINFVFFALIAGLAYVGLKYLSVLLLPFVIGFFIAMIVQRPSNFLHRKLKIPQKVIAIILVILILLVLMYALWALVYQLATEVVGVAKYLSTFVDDIPDIIDSLKAKFPTVFAYLDGTLEAPSLLNPDIILEKAQEVLGNIASSVTGWTFDTAKSIPTWLVTFIVTVVACCFISADYDNIVIFIKKQLPPRAKKIASQSKQIFFSSILKMLRAYALIMLITFTELSIGLTIIGVDNAVIISALVCIVDILPILGTGTILIPWSIINLLMGNPLMALYIILLYAVITVIRNIIEPKLVGQQVGLHPALTLILMFVGLKLFSVLGMFLLPIIMIIIKTLHDAGTIGIWKDVTDEDKLAFAVAGNETNQADISSVEDDKAN